LWIMSSECSGLLLRHPLPGYVRPPDPDPISPLYPERTLSPMTYQVAPWVTRPLRPSQPFCCSIICPSSYGPIFVRFRTPHKFILILQYPTGSSPPHFFTLLNSPWFFWSPLLHSCLELSSTPLGSIFLLPPGIVGRIQMSSFPPQVDAPRVG